MPIQIERKHLPWVVGAVVLAGSVVAQLTIQMLTNVATSAMWIPNLLTVKGRLAKSIMDQFGAFVNEASAMYAIPQKLIVAEIIKESTGNPTIRGKSGEYGLMQLMPGTARWVAKQLGRKDYRPGTIADVELNTQFGAYYFKYWFDRLERMPALAAAAYNAGPGRAQAGRAGAPLEGAVWVETIPFNETRDYVKKVLANAMVYARALDQTFVPLTTRLGTVPPRGNGAGVAVAATD